MAQKIPQKICVVATIPEVVHSFMRGHIRADMPDWSVTVICHPDGMAMLNDMGAELVPLAIARKISPWRDFINILIILNKFKNGRFSLVHSIMPKTGLLAMLAARLAGVRLRVHTFTGQVWANKRGLRRYGLKLVDKMIVRLATHIIVDSPSQLEFLRSEGVLSGRKGVVLGSGSICGVDTLRFRPDAALRKQVRAEMNIAEAQTLLLFVGRMNHEKGVPQLVRVFVELAAAGKDVVLALVGAEEDIRFEQVRKRCGEYGERLRCAGFTANPERYMAAADIFCLPSQREGFGQVIIEAAACGVPTVASDIYGIRDAVANGETGLLFAPGDSAAFSRQLQQLIDAPERRVQMGMAARKRAIELFESRKIIAAMHDLYAEALAERNE